MKSRYDAIVVGAGILGTSISALLSEYGYQVLILERGEVACGASGGNLGQISVTDRTQDWHMPLVLDSQKYYQETLAQEYPIEYDPSGGSLLIKGEAQIDLALKAKQNLNKFGLSTQLLQNGCDIQKVEPHIDLKSIDALFFNPYEAKLNPLVTTLAFLKKAQQNGATLLCNTPVTGFIKEGNHITGVQTPTQTFEAKWVLNCAGPRAAFVGKMAGVTLPVFFHKGTAFVSEPVKKCICGTLTGGGSLFPAKAEHPKRHIGFGSLQTGDGTLLICQSTELCETDDRTVNMPSLQLVAQNFLQYFPQLKNLQIVRAWAVPTTYAKDAYPVFGTSKFAENFFTVAGFKGAFTVAPAVARLALDALENRGNPLYATCSPDRMLE